MPQIIAETTKNKVDLLLEEIQGLQDQVKEIRTSCKHEFRATGLWENGETWRPGDKYDNARFEVKCKHCSDVKLICDSYCCFPCATERAVIVKMKYVGRSPDQDPLYTERCPECKDEVVHY